ncbi:MAG: hypothetical protein RR744_08345 [Cellulosilyticaceae bacterium]
MLAYRTGQYVTNSSSPEDKESIKVIQEVAKKLKELAHYHTCDKNYYHFMGLQGFKRYHRYESREAFELAMELETLLVDQYGIEPEYQHIEFIAPIKRSVLDRMQEYINILEITLNDANCAKTKLVLANHHFAACHVQKIIDELSNDLKYAYRHFNYTKEIGGQIKDLHWYSHEIHEEYKEKEKCEHGREFV